MAPLIDYSLLARSIAYYATMGFEQVEVPWLVSRQSCMATMPADAIPLMVHDRYLVGSAEQGFLDIDLPLGKYLAVSPCFRSDTVDVLHQETFIKVELHQTDDTSDTALDCMIKRSRDFFESLARPMRVMAVNTLDGIDIEIEGIEIGSYGRRSLNGRTWLYGTGLALPRFSIATGVT